MASVRFFIVFAAAAAAIAAAGWRSAPAAAAPMEVVTLSDGSVVGLRTPAFVQVGKRYAFTWGGGGPAQTYTVKEKRPDEMVIMGSSRVMQVHPE